MSYVRNDRLPHALILSGNRGVGKTLLGNLFANALLCTGARSRDGLPCGACSACTLFRAGTHPDFSIVAPKESDKGITVDAVRELSAALALTSRYRGYRVVLISPAHRMNTAAANSLLKTLEEPVPRTVIVLISDAPHDMPATIRSRCQRIHIDMPDREAALAWLRGQNVAGDVEEVLSAAMGAPLLARDSIQEITIVERRRLFETFFENSPESTKGESPFTKVEKWLDLPHDQVLSWLTTWIMDIIRLKSVPNTDTLFNPDNRERLKHVAQELNLSQLFVFLDYLASAKSLLASQVNKQLMFEDLLIRWFNLRHHSGQRSWQR